MSHRGKSEDAPTRLSKRARKLAEALAARRDLPPGEVARLARAEEAFERSQKQALARLGKGFNKMARQPSPGKGQRNVPRSSRRSENR